MDSKSAALPCRRPRTGTVCIQREGQLTDHVVIRSVARAMPDRDQVRATLAEIAENPDRIPDLPRDQAADLLAELAALRSRLRTRTLYIDSVPSSAEPVNGGPTEDRLVTVPQAADRLSVSSDWIYKRSDELPFVRKIGPQTTRVSEAALQRWMRDGFE